jgi:hypothetical protein
MHEENMSDADLMSLIEDASGFTEGLAKGGPIPEDVRKRLYGAGTKVEALLKEAAKKLSEAIAVLESQDRHNTVVNPNRLNQIHRAASDMSGLSKFVKIEANKYAKKGATYA